MTLNINTYSLEISLEAPFISAGLDQAFYGLDISLLRNHHGQIILSGDQVQGVIRQMLKSGIKESDADSTDAIAYWFGGEGEQYSEAAGTTGDGDRRNLKIFDLVWEPSDQCEAPVNNFVTRIAIDEGTDAVKDGALVTMEQDFKTFERLVFKGTFRMIGKAKDIKAMKPWIEHALQNLPALGLGKGAGFGRVFGVKIDEEECKKVALKQPRTGWWSKSTNDTNKIQPKTLTLKFEHPFMVDPDISGNIYTSSDVIPGGVLKGVIARLLGDADLLDDKMNEVLSNTVFTHAMPTTDNDRPQALPQSLVNAGNEIIDRFECPNSLEGKIITHISDFKPADFAGLQKRYPNTKPHPKYYQRTRTAINDDGLAEDEKLFVQRLINPAGQTWECRLIPKDGVDTAIFKTLIWFVTDYGFPTVGKTSVPTTVQMTNYQPIDIGIDGQSTIRIVLQTPAWLINERGLNSANELQAKYETYFKTLFGNGTELINFARDEKWQGGVYAIRRATGESDYYPYLLTQPGSVFEVQGFCQEKANDIIHYGLPPCKLDGEWEKNPFVRENGFGEVIISKITREQGGQNV